jgi:hypothetical protein
VSDWILTKGLQNLRAQVNAAFPNRDKTSDGTIGDAAHQKEISDHNPDDTPGSSAGWNDHDGVREVRAWDMDSDLSMHGVDTQDVVDHIRALPEAGKYIRYMIYNRRIYYASSGWAAEAYTGPSAHTEHIHFSGQRTEQADTDTRFDYRLGDLVMPTAAEIAKALLAEPIGDKAHPGRTVGDVLRDVAKLRGVLVGDAADTKNAGMSPAAPLSKLLAVPSDVEEIVAKVDELAATSASS